MGIIIDSCKHHFVCCHTERIGIVTEPDINSRKISFTENDEDYDNNETEEKEKDNIRNSIENMKIKKNDLIMEHQTSPWIYYNDIKTLGSGTYGIIKKVCLKKNPSIIWAMKIISKQNFQKGVDHFKLIDEIKILKNLDHPNIMKIYECFADSKNFYVTSDFCEQGVSSEN